VVVGDYGFHSKRSRHSYFGCRRNPAVDSYQKIRAADREIAHRLLVQSVALGPAVRQVPNHVRARRAQELYQNGGRSDSVYVIVAEDCDFLSRADRARGNLYRRLHAAKHKRIRHLLAQRRVQENPLRVVPGNAAACQNFVDYVAAVRILRRPDLAGQRLFADCFQFFLFLSG